MRIAVMVLGVMSGGCFAEGPVAPLVPDASLGPDAAAPCPGCGSLYVFDSLVVPIDAQQAEDLAFDLDGDGTVDNQLGNVMSALTQASGSDIDLQEETTLAISRGDILLLGSMQDCLPGLCFFTFHGSDPAPLPCLDPGEVTTCRQHLDGSGLFTVEPPLDRFIPGALVGDTYNGGPGRLVVELGFGSSLPARLDLIDARANLNGVSPAGITSGKLGGTVPDAAIQDQVIPSMHAAIDAVIAVDCPGGAPPDCGCAPDSTGETYLGIFDDDASCTVLLEEFRANSLIVTLLRPDVDTDDDGINDGLSVGLGFSAVPATFRN